MKQYTNLHQISSIHLGFGDFQADRLISKVLFSVLLLQFKYSLCQVTVGFVANLSQAEVSLGGGFSTTDSLFFISLLTATWQILKRYKDRHRHWGVNVWVVLFFNHYFYVTLQVFSWQPHLCVTTEKEQNHQHYKHLVAWYKRVNRRHKVIYITISYIILSVVKGRGGGST